MGCTNTEFPNKENYESPTKEIYKIIEEIGNKYNNLVHTFLIRSTESKREYAYKRIDAKGIDKGEREKILNHFTLLKKIDHPNIILLKYGDFSEDKKILYEISEYADGGDLLAKLNEQKKTGSYFDENTLLDWFIQLCLALKYIHSKNILHRNIKPSNIFLIDDLAKLGNFGVAKELRPGLTYTKTKVSSPQYLAPEIIEKKKYTNKADIWCLGLTFYQLMILDYPFEGSTDEEKHKNILEGKKKEIPEKCNYGEDFIEIINQMLSKKEDERPSVDDILQKGIIKTRAESYLTEKKFSFPESENAIQEYENQQVVEENRIICVEEDDEIKEFTPGEENKTEEENKIKKINFEFKSKKTIYDFHRQMSLMAIDILKKCKTFPK